MNEWKKWIVLKPKQHWQAKTRRQLIQRTNMGACFLRYRMPTDSTVSFVCYSLGVWNALLFLSSLIPVFVILNPSEIENICAKIKDVTNWHVSHKTNKTFLIEFTCHIFFSSSRWFAPHHRWIWYCSVVPCYRASTLSVYIGTYAECWLLFSHCFLDAFVHLNIRSTNMPSYSKNTLFCWNKRWSFQWIFLRLSVFVHLLWLSTSHINLV